ncbi:MAG: SGNH/GDSL hydrolase family protein [Bacilli bacterium]
MNWLIEDFHLNKVIKEESAIFSKNDISFECRLLFEPQKLVLITNYDRTISYSVEDFVVAGNKLIYVGEHIVYLSKEEYEGEDGDAFDLAEMKRFRIKRPYYSETFLQKKQLLITYYPKSTTDYFSIFENDSLQKVKRKLINQERIKVVIYGDSICVGMTSSGYMKREPFIPPWYNLVKMGLEEHYGVKVEIVNGSESGRDALWGANNIDSRIPLDADLYIIGFGMNDGTGGIEETIYIGNIKRIIRKIGNKDIILMSTILPNPDAELFDGTKFLNKQENYYKWLKALEDEQIAVANFTKLHKHILLKKNYYDISGNNINHPNDFLSRCIAIGILRMLDYKRRKV